MIEWGVAQKNIVGMERILKALANRRCLAIVQLLNRRKQLPVGDVAESIQLSFKATSKHLSVLSKADLVEWEQRSLNYYYRLKSGLPAVVRQVLSDIA